MLNNKATIRLLHKVSYEQSFIAMQDFVNKAENGPDEFWLLQHPPVYTLGVRSKEQLSHIGDIPVAKSNRGGLITYHGPGQLIVYTLINLKAQGIGVKTLVNRLEQLLIDVLESYAIKAHRREAMPGVYVANKKIASMGLRIKNGFSYHGLSINVDMDLNPFLQISPCGFEGLEMCQVSDFDKSITLDSVGKKLIELISGHFNYESVALSSEYVLPQPLAS